MNKEELQEKIQNVDFYTGEQYSLILNYNGTAFMANKDRGGEKNTQIFKTLGIENIYTFCKYFYDISSESEYWPVFHSKNGDYEPFYMLIQELLLRSYLKSKGLKYNFDDCDKDTLIKVKMGATCANFLLQDNRNLLRSPGIIGSLIKMLKKAGTGVMEFELIEDIEIKKEKQNKPLFKVGDIVRIRKRKDDSDSYPFAFTDNMTVYENGIAVITSVEENYYKPETYIIKGDGASYKIAFIDGYDDEESQDEKPQPTNYYNWSSPMLEKVNTDSVSLTSLTPITSKQCIIAHNIAAEITDVKTTVCIEKPLIQIVKHKINFKIKNPV